MIKPIRPHCQFFQFLLDHCLSNCNLFHTNTTYKVHAIYSERCRPGWVMCIPLDIGKQFHVPICILSSFCQFLFSLWLCSYCLFYCPLYVHVVFLASPCCYVFLCLLGTLCSRAQMYVLRTFSFYCACFPSLSSVKFLSLRCDIKSQSSGLLMMIKKCLYNKKLN